MFWGFSDENLYEGEMIYHDIIVDGEFSDSPDEPDYWKLPVERYFIMLIGGLAIN